MALNCKLDRNITLSQGGEGVDSCNGQDISMGVGGISSPVLVYNISDVPSLTFEGDNRSDYSLYVETINSTGKFFKVDHTDATYNEEYDPSSHKWTHTLTLTVGNIQPLFEDILSDGVNGKYLVCFRPNGSEDYRMFGWKYGATLDYSLNIQSDSLGYTLTLEDSSEYPLFTVARDNFGDKNKTYTPIFTPLYDVYYCEQDGNGRHTGYIVAMYVVKTNSAGQPLGSDNKLCQWTGKKQDAYKVAGIQSDGGYNIIGTYQKTASFDGKLVRVLDYKKCPANVTNSIFINSKKAETINLNSTITGGTYTITSTDDWSMVTDPQFVTISPVEGVNGNTQCSVHHNGVGGCEQIKFRNNNTWEIVTLNVCVNLITAGSAYTYDCKTADITIVPTVEGCSSAYTYSVSPSISNSKDEFGNIHLYPTSGTNGRYTVSLTHSCDSNEVKIITVDIVCHSTEPIWQLLSSVCELNSEGEYSGYRLDSKYDMNPYSSTFGQVTVDRVSDASCNTTPATWQLVESYCELDVKGANTGYYVALYRDINSNSPTYGQTRTERTLNTTQCPYADTDPNWVPYEKFTPYCEEIYYEPGHVLGNSGLKVVQYIDDNPLSTTYRTVKEEKEESADCPPPDTSPNVEEVSYSCQLVEDSDGSLHMNGYAEISGIDNNPFSPTYLQTTTVTQSDSRCPPNTLYTFTFNNKAKTETAYADGDGDSFSIPVVTKAVTIVGTQVRDETVGFSTSTSSGWLGASQDGRSVDVTADENPSSASSRSATATLTQNETGNQIQLYVEQSPSSGDDSDAVATTRENVSLEDLLNDSRKDENTEETER